MDARKHENSVRFDGDKRNAEIERVGGGRVWKADERPGAGEAERAQSQVVTAERRTSQRQRPSDVAVNDAHVVILQTGTGNTMLRGAGGDRRPAVNALENVDVVDVDRAQATDEVTNHGRNDDVCNRRHEYILCYVILITVLDIIGQHRQHAVTRCGHFLHISLYWIGVVENCETDEFMYTHHVYWTRITMQSGAQYSVRY